MVVSINFAQHWKKDTTPTISDWKFKFGKYIAMAKLTTYIQNTTLTKFKQEWFPYIQYIMQQGKHKYIQYGF